MRSKVDGIEQLLEKFDKMGEQIAELHHAVPEELVTWQRDDMRRKFPNVSTDTQRQRDQRHAREIWPHSRLEPAGGTGAAAHASSGPKQYRVGRAAPKAHGPVVRAATRPILREELKTKLHDRMTTLAAEAMKWP